jgi:hypothetical protein
VSEIVAMRRFLGRKLRDGFRLMVEEGSMVEEVSEAVGEGVRGLWRRRGGLGFEGVELKVRGGMVGGVRERWYGRKTENIRV